MTPNSPLSDHELGAMLGQSVRSKVDDVPTITPGFDGVERRARQITNRRRAAAGIAVGALALFGGLGAASLIGDDEDSLEDDVVTQPVVDEDDPAEDGTDDGTDGDAEPVDPPLDADPAPEAEETEPPSGDEEPIDELVDPPEPELTDWVDPALFGIIDIESDTNIDDFGPVLAPMVGFDENGTVWVAAPVGNGETSQADLWQVEGIEDVRYVEDPTIDGDQNFLFEVDGRVVHVDEEKRARLIAENATLVGADMRLGRPTAYIAFHPSAADDPRTGDLQLVDLRSGEALLFFEAIAGNDAVVRNVVIGGEVTLIDMTGPARSNILVGVANPDTAPTDFGDAETTTLSTDGSTLFWLDQVGVDGLQPQMELTVADVATGEATTIGFALPVSQVALDYDLSPLGDQLLLVRSWPGGLDNGRQTTSYVAPLLLDPTTGALTELGLEFGFWKPVAN